MRAEVSLNGRAFQGNERRAARMHGIFVEALLRRVFIRVAIQSDQTPLHGELTNFASVLSRRTHGKDAKRAVMRPGVPSGEHTWGIDEGQGNASVIIRLHTNI